MYYEYTAPNGGSGGTNFTLPNNVLLTNISVSPHTNAADGIYAIFGIKAEAKNLAGPLADGIVTAVGSKYQSVVWDGQIPVDGGDKSLYVNTVNHTGGDLTIDVAITYMELR